MCRWSRGLLLAIDDELGCPEQRSLTFTVRKTTDGVSCQRRILRSSTVGGVDRTVALENLKNLRVGDTVKCATVHYSANHLAFPCRAAGKCVNNRHRDLAFPKIAGNWLP